MFSNVRLFFKVIVASLSLNIIIHQTIFAEDSTKLLSGDNLYSLDITEFPKLVSPGDIIILGEQHGTTEHAHQHLLLLKALQKAGFKISVGLEFFEYPHQSKVDQWKMNQMSEEEFLRSIEWGKGFPFESYKHQALFPQQELGEKTFAINAPRAITAKVAKFGFESLSPTERAYIPSDFQKGNLKYFERFAEVMGQHITPDSLERYFISQSIWDDTMAFQILDAQKNISNHVIVIIVGDFHLIYGGGLPDRLLNRGAKKVHTISQVNTYGLDKETIKKAVQPSNKWGHRADWIWISSFE